MAYNNYSFNGSNTSNKDGVQYNYVSIIDTNKNEIIGQITSDWKSPSHIDFSKVGTPNHLSVIPKTKTMYVSNKDSGDIAVIDMENYKVIKRIPIGKEPHEIDFVALED